MTVTVSPKRIKGVVRARPSKSYAQRIVIASAFCEKPTVIENFEFSCDNSAAVDCICSMGASVSAKNSTLTVFPIADKKESVELNVKESGTTARIILPCACALFKEGIVAGEGSLRNRPFDSIIECLSQKGVEFSQDKLPIEFKSEMQGGVYTLNPSLSSQFLSGLLFALPLLCVPASVNLSAPITSNGYIDITRDVLSKFGIHSYLRYDGKEKYTSPGIVEIEGDASNAAFFKACGIEVVGISENSLQKDSCFDKIKDSLLIDAQDIPDLVPILSVYAASKDTDTVITNINRLRYKESDRVSSIAQMITDLGGEISVGENEITIRGTKGLRGGVVDCRNDHRIVMAGAVASQFCDSDVILIGAQAIGKSYPEFFSDFCKLGGEIYVK